MKHTFFDIVPEAVQDYGLDVIESSLIQHSRNRRIQLGINGGAIIQDVCASSKEVVRKLQTVMPLVCSSLSLCWRGAIRIEGRSFRRALG